MGAAYGLRIAGLVAAGMVLISEISYYLDHQNRPGVSPHLIGLGAAIVLLAVAGLVKPRNHGNE